MCGNASRKPDLRPDVPMRVASAICTIDRAANHRLDRDVLDREIPALGALIALNAWVFHSFLRYRGRHRCGGFGAADPLAVLPAAVSATIGG